MGASAGDDRTWAPPCRSSVICCPPKTDTCNMSPRRVCLYQILVKVGLHKKTFPSTGESPLRLPGHDAVLADAAVDRRAGHAERPGRADLVAALVEQGLDDRVPLDRLK